MVNMTKIQLNSKTGVLMIQIPKAIATAKGLGKGNEVDFLIDDKGRIYLEIKKS